MATKSAVAALVALDAGGVSTTVKSGDFKAGVKRIPFTYEKVAGNTDGDQIQLARVHRSWQVHEINLFADALTGLTSADLGLWTDEPPDVATAVDDDVYASAISLASGLTGANQAFEARDIAAAGQQVWQDAGASSMQAAAEWYRIALDLNTGGTATGTISGWVTVGVHDV